MDPWAVNEKRSLLGWEALWEIGVALIVEGVGGDG